CQQAADTLPLRGLRLRGAPALLALPGLPELGQLSSAARGRAVASKGAAGCSHGCSMPLFARVLTSAPAAAEKPDRVLRPDGIELPFASPPQPPAPRRLFSICAMT